MTPMPATASRLAMRPGAWATLSGTLFALLCLLPGGCMVFTGWRSQNQVLAQSLGLHTFARGDLIPGQGVRPVTDPSGEHGAYVSHFPVLSSKEIVAARVEETGDPARPALRLQLDRHGSIRWMQACREFPGDSLAVLVDGFLVATTVVPRSSDDPTSILLHCPLSRRELEALADSAAANYKKLNPEIRRW
ncbi:MAG: hypothetical protein JXR77_10360 [Lentisphaeria bacterium]|nr:hypothetical protein [Lentisphaeria bacterium]